MFLNIEELGGGGGGGGGGIGTRNFPGVVSMNSLPLMMGVRHVTNRRSSAQQ